MKESSVHMEKAHLASRDVDAPACDASSRNADDACVRKTGAPAQTSKRNASSAAQPAKAARAFVAENVVGLEELEPSAPRRYKWLSPLVYVEIQARPGDPRYCSAPSMFTDVPIDIQPGSSASAQMCDLSLELQQSSITEFDIAEKPDSTASEQIQNMSLKDDHDAITDDAIAPSAVQPDKIVKDWDAEAASELSPKTPGSNHWLWHPSLEEAREELSRCMEQMRQNQTWTRELAEMGTT